MTMKENLKYVFINNIRVRRNILNCKVTFKLKSQKKSDNAIVNKKTRPKNKHQITKTRHRTLKTELHKHKYEKNVHQ